MFVALDTCCPVIVAPHCVYKYSNNDQNHRNNDGHYGEGDAANISGRLWWDDISICVGSNRDIY